MSCSERANADKIFFIRKMHTIEGEIDEDIYGMLQS